MSANMSCKILTCLLFKNEGHRTATLQGGVRLAYVKCIREFGSGENCKGQLVACGVFCGGRNVGE